MTTQKEYKLMEDPIFKEFILERNLSHSSILAYRSALTLYCKYHQMTLQQLLDEADREEEEGIRAKNRSITRRLKSFRTYQSQHIQHSSLMEYMTKIKSFYRHNMIELPYIPPLKQKPKQVMYEDIPHKEHIIESLERVSNLKHRAIILFMVTSGTARQEVANLTIQDFLEATKKYHDNNTSNVHDILLQLKPQTDIIPLWQMTRQKTQYRYYTCNTPEATTAIVKYLLSRNKNTLTPQNKLFDIEARTITAFLSRLNEKMGYPTIGTYAFLHPHSFRKYHADMIGDYDFASVLQGRKPSKIREAYFKQNPNRIREEYMKYIKRLSLQKSKVVTIESDEVKELKKQHREEMKAFEEKMRREMQQLVTELKEKTN